jgi:hypothetical protein
MPNGLHQLPPKVIHPGKKPAPARRSTTAEVLGWLAPSAETVTPDPRKVLIDMRLDDELRSLLERALLKLGVLLSDPPPVKDRYGPMERRYTLAMGGGVEVVLLQIQGWVLRDGNALGSIDETRYAFRGKTVRVLSRGLDAPSAGFNTLRKDWFEREQIDLVFVPWSHVLELLNERQELAQVLAVEALENVKPTPSQGAAGLSPRNQGVAIKVFVSYSHRDSVYVSDKDERSLLAYLKGTLEREGFNFWWDQRLMAGDNWDDTIKQYINDANVALVLVSQPFLNSKYCTEEEVKAFLAARKASGLVIFPVIVSACDWESHDWLKSTQFEPREGRTIEGDYRERGSRDALYLLILKQLREIGRRIRGV